MSGVLELMEGAAEQRVLCFCLYGSLTLGPDIPSPKLRAGSPCGNPPRLSPARPPPTPHPPVYRVEVSRHPHCSCPDFARGHLCKHWLFVLLRVLRQSPDNPVIWQVGRWKGSIRKRVEFRT